MRYWEITEARMGKRDFSAARGSEVLVGFEFEIAYERVKEQEPTDFWSDFDDSSDDYSFTEDVMINDHYNKLEEFVEGADGGNRQSLTRPEVIQLLKQRTGLDIYDKNSSYTQWFIADDGSIKPSGVELVSPPMSVNDAIAALHKVLAAISDPLFTNSTTGLHINISVPDPKNIDLLKLLLFMGERYLLDMFGRIGNVYTQSLIDKVKNMIADMEEGKSVDDYIRFINDELIANAGHHNVIDIKKLKKGYLEFRPVGGEGYQHKSKQVEDAVLRLVRCIELASDPQAERLSYLKKLMALIAPTTPWSEIGLRDEENFRKLLEKDPNVIVPDGEINLQEVKSVADFFRGMVFAGTPAAATQAIFRRIFRLYTGEKRDYLNGVVKRLGQPWMEKLLK